jgi:hypothetical protein
MLGRRHHLLRQIMEPKYLPGRLPMACLAVLEGLAFDRFDTDRLGHRLNDTHCKEGSIELAAGVGHSH